MNLIALSTGLVLEPKRMWRAFRRGCICRNLYRVGIREELEAGRWPNVTALQNAFLDVKPLPPLVAVRAVEFALYSGVAMLIHASIAIPAVITRFVTDITLGYSVFQAVQPKRRTDLY